MSHKTMVNGTVYEISGGKTLIDGTAYSIDKGKTLVDGTAYEVGFGEMVDVTLKPGAMFAKFDATYAYIIVNGQTYTGAELSTSGDIVSVPVGSKVFCYVSTNTSTEGNVTLNGTVVAQTSGANTSASYEYVVTMPVAITVYAMNAWQTNMAGKVMINET